MQRPGTIGANCLSAAPVRSAVRRGRPRDQPGLSHRAKDYGVELFGLPRLGRKHEGIADPSRVTPGQAGKKHPVHPGGRRFHAPGEPLPVTQKNLLRAWIAAGATASEAAGAVTARRDGRRRPRPARPAALQQGQVPPGLRLRLRHPVPGRRRGWRSAVRHLHLRGSRLPGRNGIDEDEISSQCAKYIGAVGQAPPPEPALDPRGPAVRRRGAVPVQRRDRHRHADQGPGASRPRTCTATPSSPTPRSWSPSW